MEYLTEIAIITFTAYLLGSIPWGYIIGRMHGIDIRKHGSGNIGATNVVRVIGKKWGVLCFTLDFLKGLIPVLLVFLLGKNKILSNFDYYPLVAGFASICGHNWPIYLKFKGGKGIAVTAGVISALAPLSLLIAGGLWFIIFKLTRIVSVASISAAIFLPISAFILSNFGFHKQSLINILFFTFLACIAVYRHKSNIYRLLKGKENKFY